MKPLKFVLIATLALTAASGAAWADHCHGGGGGHINFGINLGVPLFPWGYSGYYPGYYPSYPYPPVYREVVVEQPAAPPVYIEKSAENAAPASGYWYYCTDPQGYYPYVKECRTAWMTVLPQAPTQPAPAPTPEPR
jgi:hypothetical protein